MRLLMQHASDNAGTVNRSVPGLIWTAASIFIAVSWPLCPSQALEPIYSFGWPDGRPSSLIMVQDETLVPIGLPPAPVYLPGTAVGPEKARGDGGNATAAPAAPTQQSPIAANSLRNSTSTAAAPTPNMPGGDEIWQKLRPLLPEPGNFAVIPGSELRSVLVHDGEFDFCAQIKCHRSAAVIGAWNGGAFDLGRGEFRVHGGGHSDYGGNEVYVFDFSSLTWKRETNPQALTGPFQRDANGDGVPDSCPTPAAGPPATHTYQGFLYVPKIDRYWLFGTVGYCSSGMGSPTAWQYDASTKTWTAMPELAQFAKFARAVVDPNSGDVLIHGGRRAVWREIDPVTRQSVRSFDQDPFGRYIDGPAIFDHQRGIVYALVEGRSTDRLVAYQWPTEGQSTGFSGRLVAQWPKEGKKSWGMAQHASGLLVLWDGSVRILVVDPNNGKYWEEESGGVRYRSMGANSNSGKVYSKWTYIPQVDAFFGITNPDVGIVLYRLGKAPAGDEQSSSNVEIGERAGNANQTESVPKSQLQDASVPALAVPKAQDKIATAAQSVPLEIGSTASWKEVCAIAVLCDPMGEGDVKYRGRVVESGPPQRKDNWRSIGQKFTNPQAKAPAPDPEVGGLRFTFPSNSGSGDAGNFKTDFSPDYSFQIGPADTGAPAQEAYIQFQVRYSCTFIWTDCDPQSQNYRKERRCFLSKRGDGRCTASKIALISTGDRAGWRADACTRIQIAINHDNDHALHGFSRCPRAQGFGERLAQVGGRSQSNSQPNGAYYCPRILAGGAKSGWNNSADSCFRLVDDRWITIQVHLRFGPWQPKPKKDDPRLSHVSIWAAVEGEDGNRQKLVIDNDFAPTTPENPNDFIGKIWLMPHLYDKSNKEDHPVFYVWYRNLVVSESLVPNPS